MNLRFTAPLLRRIRVSGGPYGRVELALYNTGPGVAPDNHTADTSLPRCPRLTTTCIRLKVTKTVWNMPGAQLIIPAIASIRCKLRYSDERACQHEASQAGSLVWQVAWGGCQCPRAL